MSKCGYYMFASEEKEDIYGSWIVYECRNDNCKFRMKMFEDKASYDHFNEVGSNPLRS